jgi:hypothetical protein
LVPNIHFALKSSRLVINKAIFSAPKVVVQHPFGNSRSYHYFMPYCKFQAVSRSTVGFPSYILPSGCVPKSSAIFMQSDSPMNKRSWVARTNIPRIQRCLSYKQPRKRVKALF